MFSSAPCSYVIAYVCKLRKFQKLAGKHPGSVRRSGAHAHPCATLWRNQHGQSVSKTPGIPHIYDVPDPNTDLLNLGIYSSNLKQLVLQYLARAKAGGTKDLVSNHAFVVGIHGPWGSGKSTLMEKVQLELDKELTKNGRPPLVVKFQSWRYNKREVLWRALLSRVVDQVEDEFSEEKESDDTSEGRRAKNKDVRDKCEIIRRRLYRDYEHTTEGATSLKWGALPSLVVNMGLSWLIPEPTKLAGLAKEFFNIFEKQQSEEFHARLRDLDQFEEEFTELREASDRPWLILIDDLDRCLPESAVEIFEATKVFLDAPEVVFIVALDKETIRRGLRVRYGEKEGEKPLIDPDLYVEKVTNISFVLPTLSENKSVKDLIHGIIDASAKLDRVENVKHPEAIQKVLGLLLDHQQRHMQPNPRRWIRLLNTALLYTKIKLDLEERAGVLASEKRQLDDFEPTDDPGYPAFLKFLCLSYRWGGFMDAALNSWEIMVTFEQAATQAERSFDKFKQICASKYPELRLYAEDADLFQLLLTKPKLAENRQTYEQIMKLF